MTAVDESPSPAAKDPRAFAVCIAARTFVLDDGTPRIRGNRRVRVHVVFTGLSEIDTAAIHGDRLDAIE